MSFDVRTLYLGCDPGLSGALAILNPAGEVIDITKMPETPRDISEYFETWGPHVAFALIENVHSFPGNKKPCPVCGSRGAQGVASTFKFGWNKGLLDLALVKIRHDSVMPGTWQKPLGLLRSDKNEPKTVKKNRHKAKAQDLFPTVKVTHATADALLIAWHCLQLHERRPNALDETLSKTTHP